MKHINESKIPKCSTNNDTIKCKKCITYFLFLTWTSQSFSPICDWLVTKNLHRQLDTLPEESNPVSSHWKKYKHSVEHILEIIYNDHFFFFLFTVLIYSHCFTQATSKYQQTDPSAGMSRAVQSSTNSLENLNNQGRHLVTCSQTNFYHLQCY